MGDGFAYSFHRHVGSGTGAYEEYVDDTFSAGTYSVLSANATLVEVRATYSWTYRNNEGLRQAGAEDRIVDFALSDRHYTVRVDLDEYDRWNPLSLAVWFWIPSDVQVGDQVQILEANFTVISRDATIWSNWIPKRGIALVTTGSAHRIDAYGAFDYTYTDMYYFDRASGYVIAERYQEHDVGFWQGQSAAFDWHEDFDVTSTTYPIPIDTPVLAATLASTYALFASIGGIAYGYRWRRRVLRRSRFIDSTTEVFRIRRAEDLPDLGNKATEWLGPFLKDFTVKSILAKDVAAVAVAGSNVVGFAMYNREAKIGTVLCVNTGITEALRTFVGAKDFFTEVRHGVPDELRKEAAREGVKITESSAYNVFETYQVLQREFDGQTVPPYDPTLVSKMREADLPEVSDIAERVYKVRSARWLRAQLAAGDIGYVARVGGRLVGFALATCADGHGRVHSLTVLPEFRNSGIGKELMRARLAALAALGARDAIAEIADWNLPSLEVAWRHGFRAVGKMYVETARTSRIQRTIVRR